MATAHASLLGDAHFPSDCLSCPLCPFHLDSLYYFSVTFGGIFLLHPNHTAYGENLGGYLKSYQPRLTPLCTSRNMPQQWNIRTLNILTWSHSPLLTPGLAQEAQHRTPLTPGMASIYILDMSSLTFLLPILRTLLLEDNRSLVSAPQLFFSNLLFMLVSFLFPSVSRLWKLKSQRKKRVWNLYMLSGWGK